LALPTTSYPVGSERKSRTFWLFGFVPPIFVPQGNAEIVAIARNVTAQSDPDRTVFRVPHLNSGSVELSVTAELLGPEYKGTTELSRESLTRLVMEEIKKGEWIKGAPAVGTY
jgi:hypothetical protein